MNELLFGFEECKFGQSLIRHLEKKGHSFSAVYRQSKIAMKDYLKNHTECSTIILQEQTAASRIYLDDLEDIKDIRENINIIIVVDSSHRGDELMQSLLGAGIYDAIFDSGKGISSNDLINLILRKRTREEARKAYGLEKLTNVSPTITMDQYKENMQILSSDIAPTLGKRYEIIASQYTTAQNADFISKMVSYDKGILRSLMACSEFYRITDILIDNGFDLPIKIVKPKKSIKETEKKMIISNGSDEVEKGSIYNPSQPISDEDMKEEIDKQPDEQYKKSDCPESTKGLELEDWNDLFADFNEEYLGNLGQGKSQSSPAVKIDDFSSDKPERRDEPQQPKEFNQKNAECIHQMKAGDSDKQTKETTINNEVPESIASNENSDDEKETLLKKFRLHQKKKVSDTSVEKAAVNQPENDLGSDNIEDYVIESDADNKDLNGFLKKIIVVCGIAILFVISGLIILINFNSSIKNTPVTTSPDSTLQPVKKSDHVMEQKSVSEKDDDSNKTNTTVIKKITDTADNVKESAGTVIDDAEEKINSFAEDTTQKVQDLQNGKNEEVVEDENILDEKTTEEPEQSSAPVPTKSSKTSSNNESKKKDNVKPTPEPVPQPAPQPAPDTGDETGIVEDGSTNIAE